ncbi:MAG: hypothetical protein LBG80_04695 [Bacteroidales bacterium]|nr:hypothetical protein [Bacteroidales bacterium]
MKKLIILLLISFTVLYSAQAQHPLINDCEVTLSFGFQSSSFKLYGDVKVITNPKVRADFDVRVVDIRYADMYVMVVNTNPKKCGEWRWVTSEKDADFTIRFVDKQEDFTISFVTDNPGSRY